MSTSLREYDRLPDRIRHSRQSDQRGVVVVEGPSDKRLLDRISEKRWATFPAGTRDEVVATVSGALELGVAKVVGLIDRDFDDLADSLSDTDLPIVTFDEADLEAALIRGEYFDHLVSEIASSKKVASNGGISELRRLAITFATLIGSIRRQNAIHGWGINFDSVELHQRVDSSTLSLKSSGFCAVVSRVSGGAISPAKVKEILDTVAPYPPEAGNFRGKDALILVQVALKRRWGEMRIENWEVLPAMLRLTVDSRILDSTPFTEIEDKLTSA